MFEELGHEEKVTWGSQGSVSRCYPSIESEGRGLLEGDGHT